MSDSENEACLWERWEDGQYETTCKNVFEFTHGGIPDNKFKFCPYCGGAIQASNNPATRDLDKDDESAE